MATNEKYESLAYPGVYTDENEIIPYSPRRKFGFTSPISETAFDKTGEFLDKSKIIDIESMRYMSIDQIVQLYKYGYRIEDTSPISETAFDKTGEFLDKSKIIDIEPMRYMSIGQIVQLYKYGYRIEDTSPMVANMK